MMITPATGEAAADGFLWQKCIIVIDHLIDHEPLLRFHMAVFGIKKKKKRKSGLNPFCVGGLNDSMIIILSLRTTSSRLYYHVCFLNDGYIKKA